MRQVTLFLLLALPASADILYLKNGGKIEGKVTEKKSTYHVETDLGKVTVQKGDVIRIEKKEYVPKKPAMPGKNRALLREKFANPFLGLKIYLPPHWQRGKSHGKAACSFYGPTDGAYAPRVDLIYARSSADLGKYVAMYKKAYRQLDPEVMFLLDKAFTIRDMTAYQFSAIFRSDGIPFQTLFTFLEKDGRKWVLTYACTHAWFAKYFHRVDATMRSMRLYPGWDLPREEKKRYADTFTKGEEYYRKKKYKSALSRYEKAAKILPDYPEIHEALGRTHWRMKKYAKAEAAYRKAIGIDPEDTDYHYNLGVVLLLQDRQEEAIASLEKAVQFGPGMATARTNLGVAYLSVERVERALEELEEAVLLDPESVAAHYNLGLAFERSGDRKKAKRHFKDVLYLDPKHKEAKKALRRLDK